MAKCIREITLCELEFLQASSSSGWASPGFILVQLVRYKALQLREIIRGSVMCRYLTTNELI